MNRERLLKVREAILAHKNKFNYGYTFVGGLYAESILDNDCGTVGCVAGFTCAIFDPKATWSTRDVINSATRALELSAKEAKFLFYCDDFDCFEGAPCHYMHTATADDAIERIDYLLNREVAA